MTTAAEQQQFQQQGLYDPANEHDACGVGFVAHIKGEKRHDIVTQALKILENIDHRGAVGADALMGDGAGILIQLPDALYREEMAKQGFEPKYSGPQTSHLPLVIIYCLLSMVLNRICDSLISLVLKRNTTEFRFHPLLKLPSLIEKKL